MEAIQIASLPSVSIKYEQDVKLLSLPLPIQDEIIIDTREPLLRGMVKVSPIMERFILSSEDEKTIRDVGYKFGFGGLSEAVYYRTYSQIMANGQKEKFPDTIIRVINGVLSIRKNWYINHGISWDKKYWSEIGVRMGKACMKLQMLPPGRGLWICGTDYMYERGSSALNNCGFKSTQKDLCAALIWLADSLMSGCGVGSDTFWRGEIFLPGCSTCRFQPKCEEKDGKSYNIGLVKCDCPKVIYVVHDSREGWVKSIQLLLDSYLIKGSKSVLFDYTAIREKGALIKGFGGISSGYFALEKLHNEIRSFMECFVESQKILVVNAILNLCKNLGEERLIDQIIQIENIRLDIAGRLSMPDHYSSSLSEEDYKYIGKTKDEVANMSREELVKLSKDYTKTYSYARLITDLANAIGVCIISANVRRSAEISLGHPDDPEFLNLKNYKLNPERASIGWMSNNTVVLEKTEDFEHLPAIGERIRDNGEPGILNKINVKRYGRVGNYSKSNIGREAEEDKAVGINPCITSDTLILTKKGVLPVSKLIAVEFTAICEGKKFKSTDVGFYCSGIKDIFKVTLANGSSIKATGNHQFLLIVNNIAQWKEVSKMKTGDMMALNDKTIFSSPIISIEAAGKDKVYDCSIPGINAYVANGMISHNCGEIPLESGELCCLADIFSSRCKDYKELSNAAELATIYASTISLLPTHWADTNAVINQNHRIGVSFCGIADYHDKYGFTQLTKNLKALYKVVRKTNSDLALQAGVRESIRVTTIKPNGTTVILVSESSGVHFPCFHYAIRRVRISANSDLIPILHKAGYKSEIDVYSGPDTLVFSFPIDQTGGGKTRTATQVSLWEQASLEVSLSSIWADNSISQTLYFDPSKESNIIENVLAQTCPRVKSLSMLPHTPAGVYAQSPYEEITKEEYNERTQNIKPIDWLDFVDEPIMSRGCDSDVCDIKAYLMNGKN